MCTFSKVVRGLGDDLSHSNLVCANVFFKFDDMLVWDKVGPDGQRRVQKNM